MPIDPSIALSFRPAQVQTPSYADTMGKALTLKHLMQQDEMGQQQLAAAKQENAQRQRLIAEEEAFKQAIGRGAKDEDLLKVSPRLAIGHMKARADAAKAGIDAQEARLKLFSATAGRLGALTASAKDQTSYHLAIGQAVREGLIDAASAQQLPAEYNDDTAKMLQAFAAQAMSSKEQHDAQIKEIEQKRLQAQADETVRHNKTTETETGRHNTALEQNSAASLTETSRHNKASENLTARGQTLVDSRTREANAISRQGVGFGKAGQLRDDFSKATQPFSEISRSYGQIENAKSGNAVSDIALVYAYMKMLDPGSVVREGEYATAQNAGGVPAMVQQEYNRLIGGAKLSTATRKAFVEQAGMVYRQAKKDADKITDQYKGIAKRHNLDWQDVIIDRTSTAEEPANGGRPPLASFEQKGK